MSPRGRSSGDTWRSDNPGARVALILQNDDFGTDGEKGIRQAIEGSDIEIAARETYESVCTATAAM